MVLCALQGNKLCEQFQGTKLHHRTYVELTNMGFQCVTNKSSILLETKMNRSSFPLFFI